MNFCVAIWLVHERQLFNQMGRLLYSLVGIVQQLLVTVLVNSSICLFQRMYRIAFLIEAFSNKAGMERVLAVVANALCQNAEVTIITANQNGLNDAFMLNDEINRIDLCVELNKKSYKRKLERCLEDEMYDIVVSMGGMDSYFLTDIKDGSKKILWYHFSYDIYKVFDNNWIKAWLHTKKRNVAARKFDVIVTLCSEDKKKWNNHCKKLICIPNPVTIKPHSISLCSNKGVIAVGRLQKQKGFDMLIDAWNIVYKSFPDWKLNIYGEGDKRNQLEGQIKKNYLEDIVTLCGVVEKIENEYIQNSLLVCSSRDEAFGLMIIEAERCGLPIVTFDCPSAPRELVHDGENGCVVPMGDIRGLANAIIMMLSDFELRKKMGKRSVELSERFQVEEIKKQWLTLFNELIS